MTRGQICSPTKYSISETYSSSGSGTCNYLLTCMCLLVKVVVLTYTTSQVQLIWFLARIYLNMNVLPLNSPSFNGSASTRSHSVSNRIPVIFRRLGRFQQMVSVQAFRCSIGVTLMSLLEVGLWASCMAVDVPMSIPKKSVSIFVSITYITCIFTPRAVTEMSIFINVRCLSWHEETWPYLIFTETKNTWARDDPAILILIGACLCGMFTNYIRNIPEPVSDIIW